MKINRVKKCEYGFNICFTFNQENYIFSSFDEWDEDDHHAFTNLCLFKKIKNRYIIVWFLNGYNGLGSKDFLSDVDTFFYRRYTPSKTYKQNFKYCFFEKFIKEIIKEKGAKNGKN